MAIQIEKKLIALPCIVSAGFLLLALFDLPYGYYQLLRLVVTVAAAWIAYVAYYSHKEGLMIIFIIIILLFNPVIPVQFNRNIWATINILCSIIFIVTIWIINREHK